MPRPEPPRLPPLPVAGARPERRDAAANRRRILDAARRLLAQRPPGDVSMDDVAAAAGVGKGTVFRRFGDRPGLFNALIDEDMRAFQDAFLSGPPPLGPGAPPEQRLEAFFEGIVRFQRRHLRLMLAVEPDRARAGIYLALLLHVRSLIVAIDPALPADVLAPMLLGATAPHVLEHLTSDLEVPDDVVAGAVIALLRGVTGRTRRA